MRATIDPVEKEFREYLEESGGHPLQLSTLQGYCHLMARWIGRNTLALVGSIAIFHVLSCNEQVQRTWRGSQRRLQ